MPAPSMDERNQTREHTFPAVVRLLSDGGWHQRHDLDAVTTFPAGASRSASSPRDSTGSGSRESPRVRPWYDPRCGAS